MQQTPLRPKLEVSDASYNVHMYMYAVTAQLLDCLSKGKVEG